jgi:hypothetical protein
MPRQHIWTEKDGDGRKREIRATKFGGAWRFQAKIAGETDWTYYDVPTMDDLLALQQIVARKYRRRRASADDVALVENLIRDRESNEQEPSHEPPLPFSKGED